MKAMIFVNNLDDAKISKRLAGVADIELDGDRAFRVYTSQLISQQPDLVMHDGGNTSWK